MATRSKTIEYWFPELASVTNNTDTNFTQITVYIAETVVAFTSVTLDVLVQDAATSASNDSRRQISLQLGTTGYTAVNNTNTVNNSGDQKWIQMNANFTSVFTSNWTGTSMTCDARILVDSTNASPVWSDATAKLTISYTYDDTSSTHTKTVWMPLNAPLTSLDSSKPGTANDTFPALDTWLPEASKTIRQTTIVVQGNEEQAGTVDISLSMQLDAAGASYTSSLHEQALDSSRWYRHVWQPSFTTSATHDFYIWASTTTKFAHPQVWMVITYEFSPGSSTTIMNSVLMPMEVASPMGGETSADPQVAERNIYIEEPTTISIQRSSLMVYWDQKAVISGLNFKIASGSWQSLTSTAVTLCGSCGAMIRAESDLGSFSRGKNTLKFSNYRTDTSNLGMNVSCCWIINYTSGKHTDGVGAHNHTFIQNLICHETDGALISKTTSALSVAIPETYYFFNAIGLNYQYMSNGNFQVAGATILAERLSGEGEVKWEQMFTDITSTDSDLGIHQCWATTRNVFKRWPSDAEDIEGSRLDIETSRRYRIATANTCFMWHYLDYIITYHTITYTIAGTIYGYTGDGSSIDVSIHRDATKEKVLETTTSAGGAYSVTWYDNTEEMCCDAVQDDTHFGRSAPGYAE